MIIASSRSGKIEVSAEGDVQLTADDLARVDLGLRIEWENALSYRDIGSSGGAIFFKAEKLVLRPEVLNQLRSTSELLAGLSDRELAAFLPPDRQLLGEAISNRHFIPASLDDLDLFLGEEEEEEAE